MSSKIRILDELTINQIAAGEVIENPASVVKELVENALDAGATEIHIEIACGGRQLIRVVDNGCGMTQDDALLCLERYATSKIRRLDDLESLGTMGFRGEALPSIAAISKLTLLTAAEKSAGTLVIADGGKIVKCCEAASSKGTTVEVKSLFYNVPVRKKFQKSPGYDIQAVQKCVTLHALANPEVRFELISDQTSLLKAPAATGSLLEGLGQRIFSVMGDEFHSHLLPLEISADGCQIIGYVGSATAHRPNRTNQYAFVNRRGVVSHLIAAAVREGYGTALPAQRFPVFVLHVHLPGDLLDVNVHPQKREVRLRQEQQLRDLLHRGVGAAFRSDWAQPQVHSYAAAEVQQPLPWDVSRYSFEIPKREPVPETLDAPVIPEGLFKCNRAPFRVLAALPGYLILEGQGIWVMDQRSAHQRILYDRLAGERVGEPIESQGLLIPETIQLTPVEMQALLPVLPDLQQLGIQIEPFGPQSLSIQGIPVDLQGIDMRELLMELAQELQSQGSPQRLKTERHLRLVARVSQGAIGRRVQLSLSEGEKLVNQLFQSESPYSCPRGKPILVVLSPELLEKQFYVNRTSAVKDVATEA